MKTKRTPEVDLETIMPLLIGIWRRFHKLSGPADVLQTREFRSVVDAVQALHKGLETGKSLAGQDYFSSPETLGAYLLYQWVVHYQQGLSLINELPTTPRRVLDLCSGPAPFAFAALKQGASDVIALDRNQTALKLGAEVCGRYGFPLTVRTHDCRKIQFPVEGKFDLIIVGHCLEELFPDTLKQWQQVQKDWINHVLTYLNPNGFLLIAESSLPHTNKRVLVLRDQLVHQGLAIQAPCVWKGDCVALQGKSQCYAQREFEKPYIVKEIQRAVEINLSSLKMSYLITRAPQASWPPLPDRPLYRVISPGIEDVQGKRYYLCGTDGKKTLTSLLKVVPKEARAFEYLKRGELISVDGAEERQNRFDIVLGTKINIEAPTGKPLPYEQETEDY